MRKIANSLKNASIQPDFFCRPDDKANIGGPFCGECGRGIKAPASQGKAIMWCYGCGFETGSLPMVEIPLFWSQFEGAFTFEEAQRMKEPGFDPLAEMDERQRHMQVSGIGSLGELAQELGENAQCVVLTGQPDDLRAAAPHFLSQVKIISPSHLIALREAAERRDFDAVIALTK